MKAALAAQEHQRFGSPALGVWEHCFETGDGTAKEDLQTG